MDADPEGDDFLSLLGSSSSTAAFLIKNFHDSSISSFFRKVADGRTDKSRV